jgi:hypothetical protein
MSPKVVQCHCVRVCFSVFITVCTCATRNTYVLFPCSPDSFRVNIQQVLKPQARTQFPMMVPKEKPGETTTYDSITITWMFCKFRDEAGLLATRRASSDSPLLDEFAKPPSGLSEQSDAVIAGVETSKSLASHSPSVFV